MVLYDTPRDPRLLRLTVSAVHQANEKVKELEANGRYIGNHFDFPSNVSYNERGLPRFARQNIPHYGGRFGLRRSQFHDIAFEDLSAFAELLEYVLQSEQLIDRICRWASIGERDQDLLRICIALFPLNILDRARHVFGPDPTDEELTALYLEREPKFFLDKLPVDIVVPLVMAKFEVEDSAHLARDLRIERLVDGDQLARVVGSFTYGPVNQFVAEAATHALVWTGYEVPTHFEWFMERPDFYPDDMIDIAVAAVRLAVEAPTGYAQILLRPVGWAHTWSGALPPLIRAATLHRYPRQLDEAPARHEVPTVAGDLLPVIGHAYDRLRDSSAEVRLAARRLNSAALRDREDDALLDVCIALESVLGERTEIVHKLALRVAALSTLAPLAIPLDAANVFRGVKRIYAYRSKLIHGAGDAMKAATFAPPNGGDAWKTMDLAFLLVRAVLLVLLDHPEFARSEAIEEALLATSLRVEDVAEALATDESSADNEESPQGGGDEAPG